jgi:hypothetical protein
VQQQSAATAAIGFRVPGAGPKPVWFSAESKLNYYCRDVLITVGLC